jgi:hypothetical protein
MPPSTPPAPTPPTPEQVKIAAQLLHLQVQIGATMELVRRLAERTGMKDIDGVPLEQAFNDLCNEGMKESLIGLEEKSPALAAALSEMLDRARGDGRSLFDGS